LNEAERFILSKKKEERVWSKLSKLEERELLKMEE